MNDTHLFAFESDFVATLRCVPMAVRLRLDRCAIKLSLRQWSRFTREDRQKLLEAPCHSRVEIEAYGANLVELIALRAREVAKPLADPPAPLWEVASEAPVVVTRFAKSLGVTPPSNAAWRALAELQRFALIKLTRDHHDNINFVPAMREFGLFAGGGVCETAGLQREPSAQPILKRSRSARRPAGLACIPCNGFS